MASVDNVSSKVASVDNVSSKVLTNNDLDIFGYKVLDIIQTGSKDNQCKILTVRDNKQKYIMKLIPISTSNSSRLDCQLLEVDISARIKHPNIMSATKIFGCDAYYGLLFDEGIPLLKYITTHKLSIDQKKLIMYNLLQGILFLHQNCIAHLDLKCENIVITGISAPTPKIIDFGAASMTESNTTIDFHDYNKYYYTSFEGDGKTHGSASDIQMLGMIFIDILLESNLSLMEYQ
ncbi:MAG: putative meiosis specific serine/threonine protein kinase MEK1 [Solumvirus sp.]|uniref:Putative meiosis specific serine/threonine protein kinase MEK1 n=1 Tax=Solumvirus sp. TaxID=2487773 RepID=A0A3G5AIS2_9VIRU|nr:MAG: putative meiosis specific serine/threonine protein kinase MEK1 [Solumvirus sp.]